MNAPCCHENNHHTYKLDLLLWSSLSIVGAGYLLHLFMPESLRSIDKLHIFSASTFELMNTMWWGLLLGILFVGLLSQIPREFVMSVMGKPGSFKGIFRATLAGLMLDLCSHGILLVGMKLYERGASLGQIMAFLIASPWNSLSLTIILIALIGWQWTLLFIIASAIIAIISGIIFDWLVKTEQLPSNPNQTDIPDDFHFFSEIQSHFNWSYCNANFAKKICTNGLKDSTMILRWIFFGVVLASCIRTFVSADQFETYFGPTLAGLGLTMLAATIIEVCSEGSTPIAADILNRAHAPGNSFAFLMTGVSTDYTEVMAIKETTQSWKIALFLPLVTIPQVLVVAWAINSITL